MNPHVDFSLPSNALSLLGTQLNSLVPLPHMNIGLICMVQNLLEIFGFTIWPHEENITGFFGEFLLIESDGFIVEVIVVKGYHGIEEGQQIDIILRRKQHLKVISLDCVKHAVSL